MLSASILPVSLAGVNTVLRISAESERILSEWHGFSRVYATAREVRASVGGFLAGGASRGGEVRELQTLTGSDRTSRRPPERTREGRQWWRLPHSRGRRGGGI